MTKKLVPYGEGRNVSISAKVGESQGKRFGRSVAGKTVIGLKRLEAENQ